MSSSHNVQDEKRRPDLQVSVDARLRRTWPWQPPRIISIPNLSSARLEEWLGLVGHVPSLLFWFTHLSPEDAELYRHGVQRSSTCINFGDGADILTFKSACPA